MLQKYVTNRDIPLVLLVKGQVAFRLSCTLVSYRRGVNYWSRKHPTGLLPEVADGRDDHWSHPEQIARLDS